MRALNPLSPAFFFLCDAHTKKDTENSELFFHLTLKTVSSWAWTHHHGTSTAQIWNESDVICTVHCTKKFHEEKTHFSTNTPSTYHTSLPNKSMPGWLQEINHYSARIMRFNHLNHTIVMMATTRPHHHHPCPIINYVGCIQAKDSFQLGQIFQHCESTHIQVAE